MIIDAQLLECIGGWNVELNWGRWCAYCKIRRTAEAAKQDAEKLAKLIGGTIEHYQTEQDT